MSHIIGQCMQMCPPKEIILRERERLLHPLEILPGTEKQRIPKADPGRIIKSFSRSAAGVDFTDPAQLRPAVVLIKTVKYIIENVINDRRFSLRCIYDFVSDRFRAISQDMTIQRLSPQDYVKIYEPIVKFYILYGYGLCEEEISSFDPLLHKKHFMEYMKHLLVCYDEIDYQLSSTLVHDMQKLNIENQHTFYDTKSFISTNNINNRSLLESTYILSNLGDPNCLLRFLNLPHNIKTPLLNQAFQMSLNFTNGNFIRVCTTLPNLPILAQCSVYLQLPLIRKFALKVFNIAFHSKNLTYPAENLKKNLLYNDLEELLEDCRFYKIKVSDNNINFNKDIFDDNHKLKTKRCKGLDEKLKNTDISKLLMEF